MDSLLSLTAAEQRDFLFKCDFFFWSQLVWPDLEHSQLAVAAYERRSLSQCVAGEAAVKSVELWQRHVPPWCWCGVSVTANQSGRHIKEYMNKGAKPDTAEVRNSPQKVCVTLPPESSE